MAYWSDIEAGISYLQELTESMRKSGKAAAKADAEYRSIKARAILEEKAKGTAATLCRDVIYDREDVQTALMARNCTQADYEADKEAINTMKLKLRITDAQIARDWQASGERGY